MTLRRLLPVLLVKFLSQWAQVGVYGTWERRYTLGYFFIAAYRTGFQRSLTALADVVQVNN